VVKSIEEVDMNEESLYSLRRTPPEEFARRLRASLETRQVAAAPGRTRVGKGVALAACCAVLLAAFAVPAVRATARAFLDIFRVVHFAAVPMAPQAVQRLRNTELDLPHLLGDQFQVLQKGTPPTSYPTPQEAGTAAGFKVQLPAWMPVGWDTDSPSVTALGEKTARVTIDTARLGQVLTSLGIDDETLPESINGQSATVSISPAVDVKWTHGEQTLDLLQSPSPQMQFPAGTDLAALGEIGLRILGMSRGDAYRMAQSIDWRTTLLVPVPANAVGFTQVTVQGNSGLLIGLVAPGGKRHRQGDLLLWSSHGRVFALRGTIPSADLLEVAQTIQ
jgi:hypothetical protein